MTSFPDCITLTKLDLNEMKNVTGPKNCHELLAKKIRVSKRKACGA